MRFSSIVSIPFALLCIALSVHAETAITAKEPTLTVIHADQEQSFTVTQLKARLESEIVSFVHPYYEKEKSFQGFALGSLLKELFAVETANAGGWKVQFQALDGYRSVTPLDRLFEPGGYLVFRDIERPQWEEMKKRKVSPGPFAVVWIEKEQLWENGYPWPWQIEAIRLVREQ
jgi:hypothetical protein